MKSTLLLLLAAGCLFATSCSKKRCWTCIATTTSNGNTGQNVSGIEQTTYCDKTETEIRIIEKQKSSSTSVTAGTTIFTTTTVVKCQ